MNEDSTVRTVPDELAGDRLDRVLAKMFPEYSRSRLKAWLLAGDIRVNGVSPRPRDSVLGGETVVLNAEPDVAIEAQPEPIPLELAYEDEHLLVINKPAGLVVHPGAGNATGTMMNGLLHLDARLNELPRAGIIHRLDKDTSGLLLVARTLTVHTALVRLLADRDISREYLAVCAGMLTGGGTIDEAIGRHRSDRRRMTVRDDGRPAVTHYTVEKRYSRYTYIRVRLETGRTHQIRVHFAHRRHGLLGDPVYGPRLAIPPGASDHLQQVLRDFRRQALHAEKLGFVPPNYQRIDRGPCGFTGRFCRTPRCTRRNRSMTERLLVADWPAPSTITAGTILRAGSIEDLPSSARLLQQVHGTHVVEFGDDEPADPPEADAVVARAPGDTCTVKTADCLPVLLCSSDGATIAAAHAGWRGLAAGVVEATVQRMGCDPHDLIAWLGPAISQDNFEVGDEVREAFGEINTNDLAFFEPNDRGRWQADLYELARARLRRAGVTGVYGGGWCTYADTARFYSYRRDGETGRLYSFIYRN